MPVSGVPRRLGLAIRPSHRADPRPPTGPPLGRRRTWPATAYRRFKPRNLRHRCQKCPTSQPLESHVPDTILSGVETARPTVRSHHPQIVSRRYSLAPPVRRPQCVAVDDRSRAARPEFNEGKEKDEDDDFATGIPGTAALATVSKFPRRRTRVAYRGLAFTMKGR